MLRLRKILLCNYLYYIVLIVFTLLTIFRLYNPYTTILTGKEKYIDGIINSIKSNKDKIELIISINKKEKVKANYYFKNKKEKIRILKIIDIGDNVTIYGNLAEPEVNKTKELFNYKKYLQRNNIFYIQKTNKIVLNSKSNNIFINIKKKIIKRCNNPYLKVFILGDKSLIDKITLSNYRDLGISHLFAISGMHITLLSSILLKILKKLSIGEEKRYLIVIIILLIYLFLTGISPSILRAVLFFIFFSINKIYYFYIKNTNIYILVLIISLLYNPNYIYDVGFLYSFSISLSLIAMSDYINKYNSYLKKLFITSLISFIVSIPITLYNFNSINTLSIIYNLFYVPFISIIVFPLSIITLFLPFLNSIYNYVINILEITSNALNRINFLKFNFCSLDKYFYIIYIVFIVLFLYSLKINKKKYTLFLLLVLIIHYVYPSIDNYLYVLDVGQGDSSLLHYQNTNILIDTGGNKYNSVITNITIPILKKRGINRIDYLVLSHGDFDHMGEAINLVNNFKVEKVIFNCGSYNDLEQELIKVLDKKHIKYYSCIKELNIDKNKLYFLQTKEYDNENDNSNVIYTELNGYKFMFIGDASVTTEKEILSKYNLPDIDVLKVGHHESKTSSSKEFIDEINPKYSIISVGKNNRYGHPNKEVSNVLNKSKVYRTDQDGSIMFKIKNNKLKIETCSP